MVLPSSHHHIIKGLLKAKPLSHAAQGTGRAANTHPHLNGRHQQCSESLARGSSQGHLSNMNATYLAAFRNAAAKWASLRVVTPQATLTSSGVATGLLAAAHLTSPFLALLRSLDFKPIVRGAISSLKGARPAYQELSQSFRSAQRVASQAFPRSAPATPQYAFALRRPQLPRSTFHGSGLQTARNFSSGGPTLAQVITNAPLVLRAAADELNDEWKKSRRATSAVTATKARSLNPRRTGSFGKEQRKHLAFQLAASRNGAAGSPVSPAVTTSGPSVQAEKKPHQGGDFDFYFPQLPSQEVDIESEKIITTIVIPIDPDVAGLIQGPPPAWTEEGAPLALGLFGAGLWDEVQTRTDAYERHRLRLISVFRLLDELMGVPPYLRDRQRSFHATCPALREEDLEYMPETVHNVGYKYRLQGYTADEVREALIDRLGLETGAWFAQLIREERLQTVPGRTIVGPETPVVRTLSPAVEHRETGPLSQVHSWDDDRQSLPSLPDSAINTDSLSLSSWDGMLYSPPPLQFSSAFESRFSYDGQGDEGGSYLQDSRF